MFEVRDDQPRPYFEEGPAGLDSGLETEGGAFDYQGQPQQQYDPYAVNGDMGGGAYMDADLVDGSGSQFSTLAGTHHQMFAAAPAADCPYEYPDDGAGPGDYMDGSPSPVFPQDTNANLTFQHESQNEVGFGYEHYPCPPDPAFDDGAPVYMPAPQPQWHYDEEVQPRVGANGGHGGPSRRLPVNYEAAAHLQGPGFLALGGPAGGVISHDSSINPSALLLPATQQPPSVTTEHTAATSAFTSHTVFTGHTGSNHDDGKSCVHCEATFKSKKDRDRHFLSEKHQRRMEELSANGLNGGEYSPSAPSQSAAVFSCSCGKTQSRKDLHRRHVSNCKLRHTVDGHFFCTCSQPDLYLDEHLSHIQVCGRRQAGRPKKHVPSM